MLQLKSWSSQINGVVRLDLSEKVSFDGNSKELGEVVIVDLGKGRGSSHEQGVCVCVCVRNAGGAVLPEAARRGEEIGTDLL